MEQTCKLRTSVYTGDINKVRCFFNYDFAENEARPQSQSVQYWPLVFLNGIQSMFESSPGAKKQKHKQQWERLSHHHLLKENQ